MLTRREFIKLCTGSAAVLTFGDVLFPKVAAALTNLDEKPTVLWFEACTCTAHTLSFANSFNPSIRQIMFEDIDLVFNNTIMAAEGYRALEQLWQIGDTRQGKFILCVEGTIPTRNQGKWCMVGTDPSGRQYTALEVVKWLAERAKYVVAVGTCASFGGPFAADPNPSHSKPLHKVVTGQVINVPGCPIHPDWVVGTLSHLILFGVPRLDAYNRPLLFYGLNIHDNCPRRADFENSNFANKPGDAGCLYKLGCKGPVTFADCPVRQWSSLHNNWPVEANTPCIGCVNPDFPDGSMPFFEHLNDIDLPATKLRATQVGKITGAVVGLGVLGHFLISLFKGRIGEHLIDETEAAQPAHTYLNTKQKTELAEVENLLDDITHKEHALREKIKQIKNPKEPLVMRWFKFLLKRRR